MGVEGIWGDLGEPEVHPRDLFHNGIPADFVHSQLPLESKRDTKISLLPRPEIDCDPKVAVLEE